RRPPRPPLPRRPLARMDDQPHLDRVGRADHLRRRGRGGGLRERRVRAGRCVVRRDYRPGEGPMRGLVLSAPLALLAWAAVAAVVGWWLSCPPRGRRPGPAVAMTLTATTSATGTWTRDTSVASGGLTDTTNSPQTSRAPADRGAAPATTYRRDGNDHRALPRPA